MTKVYEDIPRQPCPYVSCGSSDAFSYNTEGFGKCHSCDSGYPSRQEMHTWAKDKYPTNKESNYMNVTEFTPKRIEDRSEGEHTPLRGIMLGTMKITTY